MRPATHVPRAVAELMLARLVVEKITNRVYRFLPPDSPFPVKKFMAETKCDLSTVPMPAIEVVGGLKFIPPERREESNIPRFCHIPRRHGKYGDWQLNKSLGINLPK